MYQLDNKNILYAWLEAEPDLTCRQRMLEWMVDLCTDPTAVGVRVPGVQGPVYLAVTPVRRYYLKYLVADQFKCVRLMEFGLLE